MDFEFSAEQEMLRESVRGFLAARAPIASVRTFYESGTYDADVWQGLVDLGVVGLGMVDSAVVLEELGRAVCPAPYASASVAAAWLVPDLVGTGTVAIYEEGARYRWDTPQVRVADGALTGVKIHVPDAAAADAFIVTACDERGELGLFVTRAGDVSAVPTVDGSRKQGRVEFVNAPASRIDGDAFVVVPELLDRLGVAYAVDGVGAAARALELAVEYAHERVQFDKPIGSFQAVQHLCADMLRTVELGRAAAYYACWALDDASPAEAHRAATLARAFAADAFPQLGGTAIQVFGGIGFTWEHDIHLYYKRLLTPSVALGTAADHLEELATLAID